MLICCAVLWPCEWAVLLRFSALVSEKAMATHSSTLAWKIPWTEESGRLQSMGSLRVGHDWGASLSLSTFMHWRRKWQPTPVFFPGESQGRGSLVGCRLWGRTSRTRLKRLSSCSSTCFYIYQVPTLRISHICEDIVRYCVKICDKLKKKKKKKIVIVCSPAYVTRFSGFNFPAVALTGMTVCLTWPGVRTMSMCLSPVVATAPYSSGIPPGPQGHCRSSRSTLRR